MSTLSFSRSTIAAIALPLLVGASTLATGCGGSDAGASAFREPQAKLEAQRNPDGSINDGSRCDWKGRPDREARETAGAGHIQPNVRRVFEVSGSRESPRYVLVCREVDTNFDSIKDVVRWYNDRGESLREEADANYDGKVDTWLTFANDKLAEAQIDHNGDGKPDEWRYYSEGKLSRITRDAAFTGKPNIWEIYRAGRLERMGVDTDGDGHVDRWDHDSEYRKVLEAEERKKEQAAEAAAKAASADDEAP